METGRFRLKRFTDGTYIKYRKMIRDGKFVIEVTENTSHKTTFKYTFKRKTAYNAMADGNYFDQRYTFEDVRNFVLKVI